VVFGSLDFIAEEGGVEVVDFVIVGLVLKVEGGLAGA
jgi:hypothetical protein